MNVIYRVPDLPAFLFDTSLGDFSYPKLADLEENKSTFREDEPVIITEKVPGSGFVMRCEDLGNDFVYSLSTNEYALSGLSITGPEDNYYVRLTAKHNLHNVLTQSIYGFRSYPLADMEQIKMVALYGVAFLDSEGEPHAMFHDLLVADRDKRHQWVPSVFTFQILESAGLPVVPLLHLGPYSQTVVDDTKEGRYGIVISPLDPRFDENIGRVILKVETGMEPITG